MLRILTWAGGGEGGMRVVNPDLGRGRGGACVLRILTGAGGGGRGGRVKGDWRVRKPLPGCLAMLN